MPAIVEARVFHGGAPSLGEDVSNQTVRFKLDDNDAPDSLTPVDVPAAGVVHSYRKSFKLVCVALPDTALANLRFFSDAASMGTGRRLLYGRSTSYTEATAADGSTAISTDDVDSLSESSPLILQAGAFIDAANDTPPFDGGALQDYLMLQLEVSSVAVAGTGGSKTFSYKYDES